MLYDHVSILHGLTWLNVIKKHFPAYIGELYPVEERARKSGVQGEDLRLLRDTVARPVSNHLHGYLLTLNINCCPRAMRARRSRIS